MGFLSLFSRSGKAKLMPLPAGSFTVDREGEIMTSTLPRSYPTKDILAISQLVLTVFREARDAQMPLNEIVVSYAAFKLLARELRGGAIIYLTPVSVHDTTTRPAVSN